MNAFELPTFTADWWPLLLKPTPGSDEAITVAMLLRAHGGQAQIRQAVPPKVMHDLFGRSGAGMLSIVTDTVADLQRQLDEAIAVERLEMPYGSFEFGRSDTVLASDLNEAFDIVCRLGTSFSSSQFGAPAPRGPTESQRAFDEWARRVRESALLARPEAQLGEAFDRRVRVSARKVVRFGFVRDHLAAQFAVLRPGKSASADLRGMKVKVFDLQSLRQWEPVVQRRMVVLVGAVDPASATLSTRERDTLEETWRFMKHESEVRDIEAVRCPTPRAAVDALMDRLRA